MTDLIITVGENEFKGLLDRERVLSDVKEHLTPWLRLVEDLVNYGTNLVPRCMPSSDRKLKDMVLLPILLRQTVAMLDGIQVLLSNGAVQTANLQLRALLEAAIYVKWILAGDSERKANYYYVHNLRRRQKWALRTEAGPSGTSDFERTMANFGIHITDEMKAKAKKENQEIDRALGSKYAAINKDFRDLRKKRHGEPPWYSPLGPKNLAEMARDVGWEPLYILVYSIASGLMRSSSYEEHVRIEPETVMLQPIRYLENFGSVFLFSVSIALDLYRRVLEEYRPGELTTFSRKYVEKWQKQYLNFVKIKYENFEHITI